MREHEVCFAVALEHWDKYGSVAGLRNTRGPGTRLREIDATLADVAQVEGARGRRNVSPRGGQPGPRVRGPGDPLLTASCYCYFFFPAEILASTSRLESTSSSSPSTVTSVPPYFE